MNMKHFDDETLMAFADGELEDATSIQVEAALDTDGALAERLAVFLDTRLAVAAAMKPLINEPVPDALAASVRRMVEAAGSSTLAVEQGAAEQGNVISFPAREKIRLPVRTWLMPLAASILAVITGVVGFIAGRGSLQGGPSFESALITALDQQPSGSDVVLGESGALHIVSSFVDGRGEVCREYELRQQEESTATIACRTNGAWVTRLALSSSRSGGYVPASSQETVDAYLASINAGEPLPADEEERALARSK